MGRRATLLGLLVYNSEATNIAYSQVSDTVHNFGKFTIIHWTFGFQLAVVNLQQNFVAAECALTGSQPTATSAFTCSHVHIHIHIHIPTSVPEAEQGSFAAGRAIIFSPAWERARGS